MSEYILEFEKSKLLVRYRPDRVILQQGESIIELEINSEMKLLSELLEIITRVKQDLAKFPRIES